MTTYVRVPERTCFRCDGEFASRSTDRRVYCRPCRERWGFPAPTVQKGQSDAA